MSVLLGEQRAPDLLAAPGELRDHGVAGAHRHLVDPVASGPAALDCLGDEHVAEPRRREEPDVAGGGDGAPVVGVAGERKSRVREREGEPAMADRVPVHHVLAHGHPQRGPSRADVDELHAEGAAGPGGGPHRLARPPGGVLRRPHSGFSINDTTWPSSPRRPTSTYPRRAWKASDASLRGTRFTSRSSRWYGAATRSISSYTKPPRPRRRKLSCSTIRSR